MTSSHGLKFWLVDVLLVVCFAASSTDGINPLMTSSKPKYATAMAMNLVMMPTFSVTASFSWSISFSLITACYCLSMVLVSKEFFRTMIMRIR